MRIASIASGLVVTLLLAPAVHAEDTDPKVLAEALFQDARTLLDGGQTAEACKKFAMSQRIEPKLGTLLNLAACHETLGKTASAWAEFVEATTRAARASQPEREQFAREHAETLAPRLSRIAISADDVALPLVVSIDDVTLDRAALDTSFPIDPGDHMLVVHAKDHVAWSQRLAIPAGPALTPVHVPALAVETRPTEATELPRRGSAVPTATWIGISGAVVAATAGTVLGLEAFATKSDARAACNGAACSRRGLDLYDRATTFAHASTVAFAVAIVSAGVAVYAFVARSRAAR